MGLTPTSSKVKGDELPRDGTLGLWKNFFYILFCIHLE